MVSPGDYREVITVNKPSITIRSANPDASKTVVVNDRSAGQNGGTLNSATVNVSGDNFFAENITFENDFNRTHPQLSQGSQALALIVTGDRAIFHNVRLLGNQDTVYVGSRCSSSNGTNCVAARQYFSDCYIAGNVDFMFGDGKAVFHNCEIHSTPHEGGYITAQGKHYPDQDSGFVIDHCKLTADPGVTAPVFLGRPWRPYATVIYLIRRWMTRSRRPDGASGIRARRTLSIPPTTPNSIPPAPARITTSAIRTRISSRPTRPSNTSRQSFCAAETTGIRTTFPSSRMES